MLYCTVLYCIVLWDYVGLCGVMLGYVRGYVVLCGVGGCSENGRALPPVLHGAVLLCAVLYCIVLCCDVL